MSEIKLINFLKGIIILLLFIYLFININFFFLGFLKIIKLIFNYFLNIIIKISYFFLNFFKIIKNFILNFFYNKNNFFLKKFYIYKRSFQNSLLYDLIFYFPERLNNFFNNINYFFNIGLKKDFFINFYLNSKKKFYNWFWNKKK